MTLILILRVIHIISAIILVGSIVFNYIFLRPALNKIPPAHSVVVSQHVGTTFTIIGLTCLGLLFATGLTQLILVGLWNNLLDLFFYLSRYGLWLAVMVFSWIAVLTDSLIMTFVLRPKLMQKLPLNPNPTPEDVEKRRAIQISTSNLLDWLQLINTVFGGLAALAGASLLQGGLL